jgi:hypothetical protein
MIILSLDGGIEDAEILIPPVWSNSLELNEKAVFSLVEHIRHSSDPCWERASEFYVCTKKL